MTRIAVVEDEEAQALNFKGFIEKYGKEKDEKFKTDIFTNAIDFISDYRSNYDIIFMDILMPGMNGLEAATKLRRVDENVILVFTTNMAEYAIKGYEVSALYYLLKPISYFDFSVKMDHMLKVIKRFAGSYYFISADGDKRRVRIKDILYIEVYNHDLVYHLEHETLKTRGKLSEEEARLGSFGFVRVNYCYLVNLRHISAVKKNSIIVEGEEIAVSHSRKKTLMQALTGSMDLWSDI